MQLLYDYIFLIPLVVLLLCEITKTIVEGYRTGENAWHHGLFHPGGMPSTHSAFVTSLLMIVGRREGVESSMFAIAFCFACIVWYDAMVTRRVQGEQGRKLNEILKAREFAGRMGHSAKEVLAGILFGAVITLLGIWMSTLAEGCHFEHPLAWVVQRCY